MTLENYKNTEVETLSESAAARLLGVAKITLQRARKRGEISHFRIGSRVLYSPKQIADYLSAVERKGVGGDSG